MLKKLFILLLIAAPASMFAQEKIAYINADEIFMKMPEMKDAQTKLEVKSAALEKNALSIRNEYEQLIKKFQGDTTGVTPSILADRQAQVENMEQRYQKFMQDSQAEIEQERNKLLAPVQEKMRKAIKDVGDEQGFTYILSANALLHIGSNAVDAGKFVKPKVGIVEK